MRSMAASLLGWAVVAFGLSTCMAHAANEDTSPPPPAQSLSDAKARECVDAGKRRDFDAAIKLCGDALAANDLPDVERGIVLSGRGLGYSEKKDCERAIADTSQAIPLLSGTIGAVPFAIRGWCYEQRGDLDRALSDFNAAVGLDPGNAGFRASRGAVYVKQNDADRALSEYDKALALDPNLAEGHRGRANVFAMKGDYAAALASMNEVVRLKPDAPASYNDRGLFELLDGQPAASIDDATKTITLAPKSPVPYENRAVARFVTGDYRAAEADAVQATRLDPKNPFTYLWLYVIGWHLPDGASRLPPQDIASANRHVWPAVILLDYQGILDAQDVQAAVAQVKSVHQAAWDCEASLYLGEQDLFQQHKDEARHNLEHARDVCPKNMQERAVVLAELQRL